MKLGQRKKDPDSFLCFSFAVVLLMRNLLSEMEDWELKVLLFYLHLLLPYASLFVKLAACLTTELMSWLVTLFRGELSLSWQQQQRPQPKATTGIGTDKKKKTVNKYLPCSIPTRLEFRTLLKLRVSFHFLFYFHHHQPNLNSMGRV